MLRLPLDLAARGVGLRPQTPEDAPFLLALYESVRWPELEPTGWPTANKHAFLADQFRLQSLHYAAAYAAAEFMIVEQAGQAIGRLYLFRGERDHRIVDISLMDAARGQGIGGALLDIVCEDAARCGRTASVHVEMFNPAQSLYARKHFHRAGESGPYWLMEWRGTPPSE